MSAEIGSCRWGGRGGASPESKWSISQHELQQPARLRESQRAQRNFLGFGLMNAAFGWPPLFSLLRALHTRFGCPWLL